MRYYCDTDLGRVYEVGPGFWEERLVVNGPVESMRQWSMWMEKIPERLLQGATEITEYEANVLTGFYLPGSEAMEQVVHLLDRVRPDDPAYPATKMHRDSMVAHLGLDRVGQ